VKFTTQHRVKNQNVCVSSWKPTDQYRTPQNANAAQITAGT
jgi:hypothetical protein